MALQVGDKIPEILGINQDGKEIKSSMFAGKKLIIYFYPKDNTPGCTMQACNLRDNYDQLKENGFEVIGISADSAIAHQKFITKQNLPFELIADTEKTTSNIFGTWGEKTNYGKQYMGMFRTTYIIDETGTITHILQPKEVKTKEHAQQILAKLI